MSRQTGQQFEMLACQYLQRQGLILLAQNLSFRYGELDLVMQHADTLVIVEVKYRQSALYGSAAAAVTAQKQQKLRLAAQSYLQQTRWQGAVRFDVVAISGEPPYQLDWVKHAF